MKKRVLAIGGSYFIGRVFSVLTARETDFELCVLNRGRFPLKNDRISEIKADRHDTLSVRDALSGEGAFDAVVDFCAYEPGDIMLMGKALEGKAKQYIYIGSCSVFASSTGAPKKEDALQITEQGAYPGAEYSYHKMLLERELKNVCEKEGMVHTILRPAFVYGPFNYAPRESYYFELMAKNEEIPFPVDSHCAFSFVYVKDIARILMDCIGNETVYGESFNLAGKERVTYKSLTDLLGTFIEQPLSIKNVTVQEVYRDNIPLPFPLDQDELYDGTKISGTLGFTYMPFEEGLLETYRTFRRSR